MKWLGLGAGRRELKELEKNSITRFRLVRWFPYKPRVCLTGDRQTDGHPGPAGWGWAGPLAVIQG